MIFGVLSTLMQETKTKKQPNRTHGDENVNWINPEYY